jgi:hypothetical protein
MRYGTVQEAAGWLEAVVAVRYPEMSVEDRSKFAASVLTKLALVYERGCKARLHTETPEGLVGWQALAIDDEGWC